MKAKLLRKVRKRFCIIKFPNGIKLWGNLITAPTLVLYDYDEIKSVVVIAETNSDYRCRGYYVSEDEKGGYDTLHIKLLSYALNAYEKHGTRRNNKRLVQERLYLK